MGQSLTFNGTWSAVVTYDAQDVVFFNGSSYVSLVSGNLNHQPDVSPTQWTVFAAQGPSGATGPQGPTGPTGPQGPQGPAGISNLFSTQSTVLSLPAGIYFISAKIQVTLTTPGSGFSGDVSSEVTCSASPTGLVGKAVGVLPSGTTSTTFDVMITGAVNLSSPESITLSISSVVPPDPRDIINASITGVQFQALQVGSITVQ
jgi:hypothetical protein